MPSDMVIPVALISLCFVGFVILALHDVNRRRAKERLGSTESAPFGPNGDTTPVPAATDQSPAIGKRYRDAYFVARATVGAGSVIKSVAIGVIVVLGLGSVFLAAQLSNQTQQFLVIGIAVAVSVVAGSFLFILGILVAASGEILKATLDAAVNTSPFLSDDNRANIMSLPHRPRS